VTVTFTGVVNSCSVCDGSVFFGSYESGSGTLGTYTLTQNPFDPCGYLYHGPGPSVIWHPDTSDCTGASVTYSTLTITYTLGGQLLALIHFDDDPPLSTSFYFFIGDTDTPHTDDCCSAWTVSINTATCGGGGGLVGGTGVGSGGSATITPSC
jgi:hypothetical protein